MSAPAKRRGHKPLKTDAKGVNHISPGRSPGKTERLTV
jgi:hypothetical protein